MKTMKLGEEIKRFSNTEALTREKSGWKYIAKKEWKEKIRVLTKPEKKKVEEDEISETDKSQKSVKGKAKKTLNKK